MKPIAAGRETGVLRTLSAGAREQVRAGPQIVNPYAFEPAIAPQSRRSSPGWKSISTDRRGPTRAVGLAGGRRGWKVSGFSPCRCNSTRRAPISRCGSVCRWCSWSLDATRMPEPRIGLTRDQDRGFRLRCAGWGGELHPPRHALFGRNVRALEQRPRLSLLRVVPFGKTRVAGAGRPAPVA